MENGSDLGGSLSRQNLGSCLNSQTSRPVLVEQALTRKYSFSGSYSGLIVGHSESPDGTVICSTAIGFVKGVIHHYRQLFLRSLLLPWSFGFVARCQQAFKQRIRLLRS